jgi:hypothetical protein
MVGGCFDCYRQPVAVATQRQVRLSCRDAQSTLDGHASPQIQREQRTARSQADGLLASAGTAKAERCKFG